MPLDPDAVISQTRAWVQHAVIGLNLCPFAKAVQVKERIRYVCSQATTTDELLATLRDELQTLHAADPAELETTLLVHPNVLSDFAQYIEFLGVAEAAVAEMGLEGELQLASFHPHYQFAGTEAGDLSNATNQSPYPCLHLLREDSIEQAVEAFPEPEAIFENNLATLEKLGRAGWQALQSNWAAPPAAGQGTNASLPPTRPQDRSRS
jgi:uncharacterized protein